MMMMMRSQGLADASQTATAKQLLHMPLQLKLHSSTRQTWPADAQHKLMLEQHQHAEDGSAVSKPA
jgi:hypothetical protein